MWRPCEPKAFFIHWRIIPRVRARAPCRGGQPRARKRKASIGKNRISAVIYLPTPLVGSGWCLVGKIFTPLTKTRFIERVPKVAADRCREGDVPTRTLGRLPQRGGRRSTSGSKDTSKQNAVRLRRTKPVGDAQTQRYVSPAVERLRPDSQCTSRALWPRAAVDAASSAAGATKPTRRRPRAAAPGRPTA